MPRIIDSIRLIAQYVAGAVSFILLVLCQTGYTTESQAAKPSKIDVLYSKVVIQHDVVYGNAGDYPLKLDIVRPKKVSQSLMPVIVYVHGGSWRHGDKSKEIVRILPFAASGDYLCVSLGYRLSGRATWPAQIHDCKAAIRWLRVNSRKLKIDPERIGAWGSSAGGHLVSLLGTSSDIKELEGTCGSAGHSTRVACVVSFSGPTDFTRLIENRDTKNKTLIRAVELLVGGPLKTNQKAVREASPFAHISDNDASFLLVHAKRDPIVPVEQIVDFHEALQDAGVSSELILLEGKIHGSSICRPDVVQHLRAFFDKHLRSRNGPGGPG